VRVGADPLRVAGSGLEQVVFAMLGAGARQAFEEALREPA